MRHTSGGSIKPAFYRWLVHNTSVPRAARIITLPPRLCCLASPANNHYILVRMFEEICLSCGKPVEVDG